MNIIKGFQIDSPNIFIPWDINEYFLVSLFANSDLKRVTEGYHTASCSSLGGLNCQLGFHFSPRENGKLDQIEFFRLNYPDLQESFEAFQFYFEKSFGPSTHSREGSEGFTDHLWVFDNVLINHAVVEREGLVECMYVLHK